MKIKSILFNTDTSSLFNTALNLRYCYNQPLPLPEYNIDIGNNAEVCYVADKTNDRLEIEVYITDIPESLNNQWIDVRAVNLNTSDDILGNSEEKSIGITSSGVQGGKFKLKLSNNKISKHNIGKFYCVFDWEYKLKDNTEWISFDSTGHTIYVVPHEPLTPLWAINNISLLNTPWVKSLDFICQHFGSGSGYLQDSDIRKEISSYINGWFFKYTGGVNYSSIVYVNGTLKVIFQPVKFMNDVALASITIPLSVNCNDCASINAFLLSLLGIKTDILYLSDAYPFKNGFMCNEIISIGNNTWEIPFKNGACPGIFRYHAVCSSLDSELSYKITDSCLKVDGGINPWIPDIPNESIKVPELPFDMPFKDPLTDIEHNIPAPPYMGQFYRERLCTNPEGILACKAVKVTGNIGFDMTLTSSLFIGVNSDDIFINPLIKEKFLKYSESNRGKGKLIPNYSLNETSKKREYISIDKLSYADIIYFNNNEKPCVKVSYFNLNSYQEAILLINNFINTSVCFYKINNKLSEYTDVAFSEGTESETLLFFAIENIVIFVEKIDNSDTDIYSIAQQIINQIN